MGRDEAIATMRSLWQKAPSELKPDIARVAKWLKVATQPVVAPFDGSDYQADRDDDRLVKQHERIRDLMLDEHWRTLEDIAQVTGDPPASISAQLRHLRKKRFGGWVVEKQHLGRGLYQYRLKPPPQRSL